MTFDLVCILFNSRGETLPELKYRARRCRKRNSQMADFPRSYIFIVKAGEFLSAYELDVGDSSWQFKFIKLCEFLLMIAFLTSRDQIRMVESNEALIKRVLSGCSQRLLTIRL